VLKFNKKPTNVEMKFPEDPYQEHIEPSKEETGTVSSYRGIFNRTGLPLPRGVRVEVDSNLVKEDPKIAE